MAGLSLSVLFSFLGDLHCVHDDLDALVDAQHAGAQAHLIVLSGTPGTAGVVLIVDAAALVLFFQTLLGTLLGLAVEADDTLCTVGDIGKNVNMEGVGAILQNIIGILANRIILCKINKNRYLS